MLRSSSFVYAHSLSLLIAIFMAAFFGLIDNARAESRQYEELLMDELEEGEIHLSGRVGTGVAWVGDDYAGELSRKSRFSSLSLSLGYNLRSGWSLAGVLVFGRLTPQAFYKNVRCPWATPGARACRADVSRSIAWSSGSIGLMRAYYRGHWSLRMSGHGGIFVRRYGLAEAFGDSDSERELAHKEITFARDRRRWNICPVVNAHVGLDYMLSAKWRLEISAGAELAGLSAPPFASIAAGIAIARRL